MAAPSIPDPTLASRLGPATTPSPSAVGWAPSPKARLLVRGVNWVGDAVMTTPALQRLRERFPSAHITLFTDQKLAGLWEQHPSIDALMTFTTGQSVWSVARRLVEGRFEAALVLPNSPRSALEPWLARIPERVGLARPWRGWLLTRPVPPRSGSVHLRPRSRGEIRRRIRASEAPPRFGSAAHHIHDYLHLVAALGANPAPLPPRLMIGAEEVRSVAAKFGLPAGGADAGSLIGLNPGAQYGPAKRWPIERWAEVACHLEAQMSCTWLIFGGPADQEQAGKIEYLIRERRRTLATRSAPAPATRSGVVINVAGRTSLRELCALVKSCRVLLTNDSGPMHVAAALQRPVVVPFGSTSPELTGPGLPGDSLHRLLSAQAPCSPCFRRTCPIDFRCMTGITVDQVVAAVRLALREPLGAT